ncbi:MAG TPA: [Fe-Fe] hydrogenase large subunit C-terminal domain-containing protein [Candidatus Paceibacterota bacterium]|nr:[Fe-Fe] hydrogenase large subunit C-terminal domain-containing protein [Verrucomicrobiota bacterium]HRY49321.1 [Fe-Fe] hydrogenase large subunit C-terminal domain-containing protein [Candidatus Paceibacterota bacterium]HRZ99398.1 [Fe-Fe] hydrogenase large subunit C-terminal domain-containing protein [Candidatus Paceibacterota bacterium]
MDNLSPIYTEKRECQDCYKCVRHCPVKAIKVEAGCASVIPNLCIYCGECVAVCPSGAKRVRDDLPAVRQLLATRERVLVSLAPSFVSEFPELRPGQLIRGLRELGFHGVSETALGAQQVSAQAAALLEANPNRVLFSSACPTVVCHLQKHRPEMLGHLTGLLSPLLTHGKMLRSLFGEDIGIVFIGPCIAKKIEAAQHPELINIALTFADLRRWFKQAKLIPEQALETPEDCFIPEASAEGAWYPIDGGMIAGMKSACAVNENSYMAFSGIPAMTKAMDGLEEFKPDHGLFLELLACEGGCVNGPQTGRRTGTAAKRYRILQYARPPGLSLPRTPSLAIPETFRSASPAPPLYTDAHLREALRLVGKNSADDEMNCGGCGYDSCRAFAIALITQKAERSMCVTYMRKLALKKAHALIQKMPSAVVVVNEGLRILEHNAAFTALFVRDMPSGGAAPPGIEGGMLSEWMPFAQLFHSVLKTGEDILDRTLRFQETILSASIFTIERHCVVAGILEDVTKPAVRKEQVIRKARGIIQKNLETVQKIACLLGENAAESEIALNSIIESFSPRKPEEPEPSHDWRKLYRR